MAITAAASGCHSFCSKFMDQSPLSETFELLGVTFKVTVFEKMHGHTVFQITAQGVYRYRRP
jgi:hypothetical protein